MCSWLMQDPGYDLLVLKDFLSEDKKLATSSPSKFQHLTKAEAEAFPQSEPCPQGPCCLPSASPPVPLTADHAWNLSQTQTSPLLWAP